MLLLTAMMPTTLICMGVKSRPSSGGGFGKPKGGGGGGGGFGKPKPKASKAALSFEEVAAKFKTREPSDASTPCACGLEQSYADCCRPYHQEAKPIESTEWCLRSRFTAFAYRLPRPIIATTHPDNRDYQSDKVKWARLLDREGMFDSFDFVELSVGAAEDGAGLDESFLTFTATLRPRDGGPDQSFTERSRFLRSGGSWLYASGEVRTDTPGLVGRVLNE